jgi:hypothetical protein
MKCSAKSGCVSYHTAQQPSLHVFAGNGGASVSGTLGIDAFGQVFVARYCQ